MNKQFIDGALEVLREDGRQICKQAAHIIAELVEEIDGLQSLSDFQQQQISCMESTIEKMKCCANCEYAWQGECSSLSPESKNQCFGNESYSLWGLKKMMSFIAGCKL